MDNPKPILYKLPLGADILPQFIEELKNQEDAALVLANGLLKERVQFEGITHFGLDTLASKILNANGYTNFELINRRTQELVIEEWVDNLKEVGKKELIELLKKNHQENLSDELMTNEKLTYFEKLADKKGFIKSITNFVNELSATGLDFTGISSHFKEFETNEGRTPEQIIKDKEVLTLYAAYRSYLKQKDWYDIQGQFRLALHVLQNQGDELELPWKKLRIFGFYALDPLRIELLKELSKHVDISLAMFYETNMEDNYIYSAASKTYECLLGFCQPEKKFETELKQTVGLTLAKHIFKNLSLEQRAALYKKIQAFAVAEKLGESQTEQAALRLLNFSSRDKEIRFALGEIKSLLKQGVAADKLVLVIRDLDKFSGIGDIAKEYGIPLRLSLSCKLSVHPIYNFIKLLYAASMDTHDGAEAYLNILTDPFAGLFLPDELKQCKALCEKIYFKTSQFAREKVLETYPQHKDALTIINEFITKINKEDTLENYIGQLDEFLTSLNLFKILGARHKDGLMDTDGVKSILAAEKALHDCIRFILEDYKFCGKDNLHINLYKWLNILFEAASTASVILSYKRADGVRVIEAANMQGLAYDHVYMLGMVMGEFPVAKSENWVYNDVERNALNLDLKTISHSFNEDVYFLVTSLAAANKTLTISWHTDDNTQKSPYIDELQRIFMVKNSEGKYESQLQIIKPKEECIEPSSVNELWKKHGSLLKETEHTKYAQPINMEAAINNGSKFLDEEHLHYHGKLINTELIAQAKEKIGNIFSASGLNKFIRCPYSFLLDKGWGLGDGKVMEEQAGAPEIGSLIHDCLSKFIDKHLNAKLDCQKLDELAEEMDAVFDEVWQDYLEKGKVNDSPLWQADKNRMRKQLQNWLKFEAKLQAEWSFLPFATELEFKKTDAVPLELTDKTQVKLQGAIDRLDESNQQIFITDYKTGATPNMTDIYEGRDMQTNVYLLAAKEKYPDKEVAGIGYYQLKALERKPNLFFTDTGTLNLPGVNAPKKVTMLSKEQFEDLAKNNIIKTIESIYQGKFVPTGRDCSYCSYNEICRKVEGLPEEVKEDG